MSLCECYWGGSHGPYGPSLFPSNWDSRLGTFELFKEREIRLLSFWASLPKLSPARSERLEDLRQTVREREMTSDPLWAPLLKGDRDVFIRALRYLWGLEVKDPRKKERDERREKERKEREKRETIKFEEGEL